jgi:uncharacterized damage-inducible protein DinB
VTTDIGTPLRALVAYNERANAIVLEAITGLTDKQLDAKYGASWESIRSTLQHVATAQGVWLKRFGAGADAPPDGSDLRTAIAASDAALTAFVDGSSAADLERVVEYTDSRGQPFAVPLWQLLMHVCNHGTHHRAECGMLLGQLGRSPGDIDFVYHVLGRLEVQEKP